MGVIDQQIKHNDCGISAVKTIFNLYGASISRQYIQDNIFLDEKGSRISDLKSFFEQNDFSASYKFIDLNYLDEEDVKYIKSLIPFIIPIKTKRNLHYIVVKEFKNKKFYVLDPAEAKEYILNVEELKQKAYISKSQIKEVDIKDKIEHLIETDLRKYGISRKKALNKNEITVLYNKLTYFSYHIQNFEFKNLEEEKKFLSYLIFKDEINFLPKSFRTLKYDKENIDIQTPLILSVTPKGEDFIKVQKESEPEKNVFFRLIGDLGKNRKLWNIYLISALFAASVTQLAVFINQILIDNVLPSFQINILILFAIGVGVFRLFELIITQYRRFVAIHLGNLLDKYFIKVFDEKLNVYPIQYTQSYRRGDLTERLSDSLKLKAFFLRFFAKILVDSVISIYSLAILFFIDWKLSLIVSAVVIIYYLWFKFITPYLQNYERQRFQKKADLFSKMIEKIDGLQVIKSFKLESIISNKVLKSIDDLIKVQTKLRYIDLFNTSVVSLVTTLASLSIIVFLAKDSIENQTITIGQILTFILLSGRIFTALSSILNENLVLQEHGVILKRYFDFQNNEDHNLSRNGVSDFQIKILDIENVSFGYFPDKPIIQDINIQVEREDRIQIEGKNGTGKSTFSKVLSLLYKNQKGSFIINGTDISFYDIKKLKEKILLISNEDLLFNETIDFNISFERNIPFKRIIEYAKAINLYDFIIEKEDKLDFVINEGGKNLSTGQRKKILLLRGLLSKAEIIILDEVLSGIDSDSRQAIEKLINSISNKTFIIISHEPVKEIDFNKKYKFDNGRLVAIQS